MSRKTILWIIDPYDPILSYDQIYSMCQSHYNDQSQIYIQLLEYHPHLYRKLSEFGTMLPPFSWNSETNRSHKNIRYQFGAFSIPNNIRIATYNYPSLVKIYWQHVKDYILKDSRIYDEATTFSQGLPQYYVKDKICAKKINTYLHVFQPEYEELFYGRSHLNLTNSASIQFHLHLKKMPVKFVNNKFAKINREAACEIGSSFMDRFSGIRILVPNDWNNLSQLSAFFAICKILNNQNHLKVKFYLFGEGKYSKHVNDLITDHQLYKNINLLRNIHNLYRYVKDADMYLEWDNTRSFIKEAIWFDKPVYSYKYNDHCNTYLDHKLWNKGIAELLKIIRNTK
ncbi:hypothetical protein F9U64_16350 [Gracilibacillus oryzae]|uniref:Glycosyltransferase n=1 Tax=Gracilibacillus oryzae TaxID=1672701 RepID=A0A7C8KQW1_9BACI|nr:hypothetical protein [Gracilibacillus oryzae]KAB8128269.1 hypothetical protein F9U64_16350 [Gracilibacillus oryzae]